MSYKVIEPVLTTIDDLSTECGLFHTGPNVKNGGYGCASRSKDKQEPGCCFAFDCPLAHQADLEDLKKHDDVLYEQYKDEPGADESCGDWVVQYRKCAVKST